MIVYLGKDKNQEEARFHPRRTISSGDTVVVPEMAH